MKTMHGFELIEERFISELNTHGRLYRHQKTGAQLLSLENQDENKVFGITFRTPVSDSTGVPHILEHSVLGGSRKYPVKDPFRELSKGSLNTFLNAFTYPDKTCYPVASQNLQDFYNLVDVYLDAVLFPLITPFTLQQEGWHYELPDFDAGLQFKGVVFNEMKGNYSSPDILIYEHSQRSLFPDNTYRFDSGGDPEHIPDLTYAQFKEFHTKYYHPSNAYIYFYGDDDPEGRLRIVGEYLQEFETQPVESAIELQPQLDWHPTLLVPYDASGSEDTNQAFLTVNWLLPEVLDPETALSFVILAEILIGTPASPLRKALIDSGLGEDLTGAGLETDLRQMFFSTGLKGIRLEDAEQVKNLVFEALRTLAGDGIDPGTLAAALNTVEFRLRENNTGRFPRGLSLMLRSLRSWLYGGNPFAPLAFEAPLNAIKAQASDGVAFFENLIQEHFIDNPHRATVILKPDPQEGARREAAERERLQQTRAAMGTEELKVIRDNTHELKRRQEAPDSPEDLAKIPVLQLSDLDEQTKRIPLQVSEQAGTKILFHDLFTNGILYLDVGFDLHTLPGELLSYVPLFGRALLEMGTDKEDFVKLSQRIGRSTGGIRPATFTSVVQDSDQSTAWLFLRGKSTFAQAPDLLEILRDVLLRVNLDNQERFKQIVLEEKAGQEGALIPMGHRVVNSRLRSAFNPADWAGEQMSGIDYLLFLRQLAEKMSADWPAVLADLEMLRTSLLNRQNMIFNLTLDESNWRTVEPQVAEVLATLPSEDLKPVAWMSAGAPGRARANAYEGLTIPAQVNYVGKGANLYQLGYQYDGSMAVILNHLRSTWLYEQVRLQGGAYGAFSVFDHRSGVLTYLSYRDPNLVKTLEVYDRAGQFLLNLDLNADDLTKDIIGAIGEMDAYQLPDAKGYTSMQRYLAGDDDEKRQQRRDQILSTRAADFHALGDVLDQAAHEAQVVVLGSESAVSQLKSAADASIDILKVL
jgi:Zn-dependent M16 (insulinase) family peptidase